MTTVRTMNQRFVFNRLPFLLAERAQIPNGFPRNKKPLSAQNPRHQA